MTLTQRDYGLFIETLISVFTVDESRVRVLLIRKEKEPYKGYWELPGDVIKNDESLENNITDVVYDQVGLTDLNIEQSDVFGAVERDLENRMVAVSYLGIIDVVSAQVKKVDELEYEIGWFDIDTLPKLAYDHLDIILKSYDNFKKKIKFSSVLNLVYPSDFTLPEIQRTMEGIYEGEVFDRRNFRKKFMNLDLIEDTGLMTSGNNGRPAKLYKFREDIDNVEIV